MPSVIRGSDGFDSGAGIRPIAEYQVTGAAVQQIDFNGLDMAADGYRYDIEALLLNPSAAGFLGCDVYINGDLVDTNYYNQITISKGTSITAVRQNVSRIGVAYSSGRGHVFGHFTLDVDGYVTGTTQNVYGTGAVMEGRQYYWSKTDPVANVTSITLKSSTVDGFGVGTRIRIYRRAA